MHSNSNLIFGIWYIIGLFLLLIMHKTWRATYNKKIYLSITYPSIYLSSLKLQSYVNIHKPIKGTHNLFLGCFAFLYNDFLIFLFSNQLTPEISVTCLLGLIHRCVTETWFSVVRSEVSLVVIRSSWVGERSASQHPAPLPQLLTSPLPGLSHTNPLSHLD